MDFLDELGAWLCGEYTKDWSECSNRKHPTDCDCGGKATTHDKNGNYKGGLEA